MKHLNDFIDEKGWIGHKHKEWKLEFGDGVQRLGTMRLKQYALNHRIHDTMFEIALEYSLQIQSIMIRTPYKKKGKDLLKIQFVRHWDSTKWPGQLWVGSRDNFEILLITMGLYAQYSDRIKSQMDETFETVNGRLGLMWNWKRIWPNGTDEPKFPDFILPWNLHALNIRCKRQKYLRPLLYIYDLDRVANSILICLKSNFKRNETSNDLNHQNRLVFSQLVYPTITNSAAKWIYKLCRRNPGDLKKPRMKGNPIKNAFKYYYRNKIDPPMAELWEPVQDEFL